MITISTTQSTSNGHIDIVGRLTIPHSGAQLWCWRCGACCCCRGGCRGSAGGAAGALCGGGGAHAASGAARAAA